MDNIATQRKTGVSLVKTEDSIDVQRFRASVNAGLRANDLFALQDFFWFEARVRG